MLKNPRKVITSSCFRHTFGVKERKLANLPAFFSPRRKAIGDAMLKRGRESIKPERNGYEMMSRIYFRGKTLTIVDDWLVRNLHSHSS